MLFIGETSDGTRVRKSVYRGLRPAMPPLIQ